jgi:hypothetical protein
VDSVFDGSLRSRGGVREGKGCSLREELGGQMYGRLRRFPGFEMDFHCAEKGRVVKYRHKGTECKCRV